jgi:hypothetical protein
MNTNKHEVEKKLSPAETRELARHEKTIRQGLGKSLKVWQALNQIREQRLYREKFGTFEDYCQRKLKISRSRAYQLCWAAAKSIALAEQGIAVENEWQSRNLSTVVDTAETGQRPVSTTETTTYDERALRQHKLALAEQLQLIRDRRGHLAEGMAALKRLMMENARISREIGLRWQAACNHDRMTPEFFAKNLCADLTGSDFAEASRTIAIARRLKDSEVKDLAEVAPLAQELMGASGLIETPRRTSPQKASEVGLLEVLLNGLTKFRQLFERVQRDRASSEWTAAERRAFLKDTEWLAREREEIAAMTNDQ